MSSHFKIVSSIRDEQSQINSKMISTLVTNYYLPIRMIFTCSMSISWSILMSNTIYQYSTSTIEPCVGDTVCKTWCYILLKYSDVLVLRNKYVERFLLDTTGKCHELSPEGGQSFWLGLIWGGDNFKHLLENGSIFCLSDSVHREKKEFLPTVSSDVPHLPIGNNATPFTNQTRQGDWRAGSL